MKVAVTLVISVWGTSINYYISGNDFMANLSLIKLNRLHFFNV